MAFWRDLRLGVHLEDSDCPEPLVRPCLGPQGWIVGKSAIGAPGTPNKSRLWKWNGAWEVLSENCVGAWGGAIDYAGRAVWIERRDEFNDAVVVREPSNFGSGYEILDVPYQSAGIRDILPDNTVVMDDGSQMPFRRSDGSQILIPKACVRGDYVAGYANNLPGGNGVVVGRTSTGEVWRVFSGDPQSLPIRLDDNGQTVAISGNMGGFVPAENWTEEPFAPPLPDIQPFTSPKIVAPYPASNGALTTHSAGMNSRVEFGPGLVAYPENAVIRPWVDLEQGGVLPSGECVAYCDESRVLDVVPLLKPWQVIAFNCYPNPGEGDFFEPRIEAAINEVHGDYILVTAAWNRGTLTDEEVLAGMKSVFDFADYNANCLGVAIFGLDRGTSLGQFKPLYQQCADLFSSPQGRPAFPVQPQPPIPPTPQGLAARKIML